MKNRFILSLFLFCACHQERAVEVVIINPGHFTTEEVTLSDLADEVTYIPLDTAKLFNGVMHSEFTDDFIFISTGKELLKYDHTGKLLQQVGTLGPGPEEYTRCLQFSIDRESRKIFVLCSPEIVVYSFDGKFLNRMKLPEETNPIYIRYQNQSLYCFSLIQTTISQPPYLWVKVNVDKGQLEDAKPNTDIKFQSDEISVRGNYVCESSKGALLYWNHFSDTIYRLNKDQDEVAYLWGKGDFRLTSDKMTNKSDGSCLVVRTLLDTRNFLFIEYRMNDQYNLCLYNKEKKQFIRHPGRTIPNDIDHGIPFQVYDCQTFGGNEYLIQTASPDDLKEALASPAPPVLPAWVKDMKEDDNEVLIMAKLK